MMPIGRLIDPDQVLGVLETLAAVTCQFDEQRS